MKILVTGATGFIGNHLIPILLQSGHSVIAIGRNQKKASASEWYNKVSFITFDISILPKEESLYNLFDNPDVLIHLAWDGLSDLNDLIHVENNLFSHYEFLKSYINSGGKHILVTGTCLEYGIQIGCLDEEMPVDPITSYGIAKNSLRQFLYLLGKNQPQFIFQWVRLFYMYGKGQHPRSVIPQLEEAILRGDKSFNMSGGEQLRDYLPVTKVAQYLVKIAEQNLVVGVINCCSGQPIAIKTLVKDYAESLGSKIELNLGYYPYTDYEPMAFWGDNKKLKKLFIN
ncbi:MAG: NAD-dependent epimerase/dehydratase family protein [bacterium]